MLVDEVFSGIPETMYLADAPQPWVPALMTAINENLEQYTALAERLIPTSTGKELRQYLGRLPGRVQVTLLNDHVVSFGNQKRRMQDKAEEEKIEIEIMEKKLRYKLIKFGAISAGFLAALVVITVVIISFKQNTTPDAQIATGLFNMVVEIIKLIFSVT